MDKRLQLLIDDSKEKFGLDRYTLGRTGFYKRIDYKGRANYIFNMEWFPLDSDEQFEEDENPAGTASIDYNIQHQRYESVIFTEQTTYSEMVHFTERTREEAVRWIEQMTGFIVGENIMLASVQESGYVFKTEIDGLPLSPGVEIELQMNEEGKLLFYSLYGNVPAETEIERAQFSMTLEEIEPLVKQQLQLGQWPVEDEERYVSVYAIDEEYIAADDQTIIPFFTDARFLVKMNELLKWDETVPAVEIERKEISLQPDVTIEEAFNSQTDEVQRLSSEEVKQSQKTVRSVMRTLYPQETDKWILDSLHREENFITARCVLANETYTFMKRKVTIILELNTCKMINYMDNKDMANMFEGFTPAEKAVISHEEAFELLVPYITLDPTYVYDPKTGKYRLCGLLDSAQCVNAATGEVIQLNDL